MKSKGIFLLTIIGIISGVISGFFGSGGGMVLVPLFSHVLKLDEVKSRATTIFCMTFIVITSSIFYIKQSYINFELGIKCAIGGVVGGFIGSKLLMNMKSKYLELIFIVFLIYSATRLVF